MPRQEFATRLTLIKIGNSYGVTIPKDQLREAGVLEGDGLVADVDVTPWRDDETGEIGVTVPAPDA